MFIARILWRLTIRGEFAILHNTGDSVVRFDLLTEYSNI